MTAGFLTGLQLADSFLPVGNDSSSYGLEQFVASGRVTDIADVDDLLETYLRFQLGPMDLVALRAAHHGIQAGDIDDVVRADERLHAMTLPAEFRQSSTRAGTQLCDLWLSISDGRPHIRQYAERDVPKQYAIVQGAIAAAEGVAARNACLVYCYGFCSSMLAAAQRLLSLGHTAVQDSLRGKQSLITTVVEASDGRSLEHMSSFTPELEIQSANHQRAERRLFMS
jgi:urease accessory protein